MKSKIFEMYVVFQGNLLRVEEFCCMNENLILFNPDSSDTIPDYKIQLSEKVFLKDLKSDELKKLSDIKELFQIVNSSKEIIATSDDLKLELVEIILDTMEKRINSDNFTEDIN